MRGWWTVALIVAVLAVAFPAVYAELVLDARTPRSALKYESALGVNVSYSIDEYNKLSERMQAEYGSRAETSLEFPPGKITVKLDGRVIQERRLVSELSDVVGLFVVGQAGLWHGTFPFRLAPDQSTDGIERRLVDVLKRRFGKDLPARALAFSDNDWTIGNCMPLLPQHLGRFGPALQYKRGTACVVAWKGPRPVSMLLSVSIADGDPWMRPFTRRICRMITEAALAQAAARGGRSAPNYAGCVLADRPRRNGAAEVLSDHLHELRPDGTLALIN
jgi:hypothetical protein